MSTARPRGVKSAVIVYLDDVTIRRVRRMADRDYMTLSAEVRKLLIKALDALPKEG